MIMAMGRQRRIIIADRSELAGNMYKLLLDSIGANLIVRKRFEEARPHFFRREKTDLGIFNSNIFGKKFDEIYRRMGEAEPIVNAPKIFLCRDNIAEARMRDRISRIANSSIIIRPFHPDDFFDLVGRLLV